MRVAVVGEGVVGLSTATVLLRRHPGVKVTIVHDRPFEKTCSFGPAGLFRIDFAENKEYGRATFARLAELHKQFPGEETGVKLVSGTIQSEDKERLKGQEKNMSDIVYGFRWLDNREIEAMHPQPSKYCIGYSAYAAEGNRYVPFMKRQLQAKGVRFEQRKVDKLEELTSEYSVVFNCAGLDGGSLAGDDTTVYPVRGVVFEVHAPWHKTFNYRDFSTFTIPKQDSVVVGSVKQDHRSDLEITDEDRKDIWERYLQLHPAMKGAKVLAEWSALRPARPSIRIEAQRKGDGLVIHHYGHGGNGFTLGWGTSLAAVDLFDKYAIKAKL